MPAYITSIGTANPSHAIRQADVLDFMIEAHGLNDQEAHDLRVLYRASGIQQRYSTIPDYGGSSRTFFSDNESLEPFPDMAQRSTWYKSHAATLSMEAAKNCMGITNPNTITHLITVSCTGMYAPGLDIELVQLLELNTDVERTCINFMGCYAAFNALKVADHICRAQEATVLIVCTELCTLHFQKEKTDDNLLANALFGDGSAAVLVSSDPASKMAIELTEFRCALLPSAGKEMAWNIGNLGFEMRLSAYVPQALKMGIPPLLSSLKQQAFDGYAIHPGGKRILDVVEKELGITRETNQAAHDVLRQYGNMSSPTILFVLKTLMDQLEPNDDGKKLLGLAFGPGLTLESFVGTIHA
jgi:predicted naringenin-chalcone synthase